MRAMAARPTKRYKRRMTVAMPLQITAFYAGLAALWLVVLAVRVIRLGFRYRVGLGAGGHDALDQARRVHGNAAEWLPIALLMMLVLELLAAPIWLLHAIRIALAAGRALHATGLSRTAGASWQRTAGMMLTFIPVVIAVIDELVVWVRPRRDAIQGWCIEAIPLHR